MVRVVESVGEVKVGARFERWEVIGQPFRGHRQWQVVCQCDCGRIAVVSTNHLRRGGSGKCKSCQVSEKSKTHSCLPRKLHTAWGHMKKRCSNPDDSRWKSYGARGICVCPEWERYEPFRDWALANGYEDNLELDRIDVNGNYEPGNCRWVTSTVQQRNRTNNFQIEAFGETKCLAEWADDERCKVKYWTLYKRIKDYGMAPEAAITTSVKGRSK